MPARDAHLIARTATVAVASAVALFAAGPAAAAPPSPAPVQEALAVSITVATPAQEVLYGSPIIASGGVSEGGRAVAGALLELQADPYPFRGFATVGRTTTAPDGSFAFAPLRADRNVRLRVVRAELVFSAAGPQPSKSPVISVYVDPRATLKSRSLGPGRTQLTLRMAHTTQAGGGSVEASWFVAARGTRVFRLLAVTPTRELRSGLLWASAIIDPPARHFAYRVCLTPPWEAAMSRGRGRCPRGDYAVGHNVG